MPFARTGPLRRGRARTLRSRPFAVRFWGRTLLPRRMVTERCSRCARRRRWRARCVPRGSWGSGGRTSRACSGSTTSTPRSTCSPTGGPAAAPIDQGPARACGGVRARADAAAPSPGGRAAPARPASSPPRDARAARHRYDVSNEFFALFLALADRHEHRACRSIPARREDAGGGPPGEARVRLRQARARARRACASAAAAAAGAASRSTVVPLAALSWSGSLGPSPRRASRSTGRRGRASPTGSRSA